MTVRRHVQNLQPSVCDDSGDSGPGASGIRSVRCTQVPGAVSGHIARGYGFGVGQERPGGLAHGHMFLAVDFHEFLFFFEAGQSTGESAP